jgi:hypothetical protein
VDAFGNIFVLDSIGSNPRIQKFDPNGAYLATLYWSYYGSDPGKLYRPSGLAFAPNGDLFVVDDGNSRIEVFNKDYDPDFDLDGNHDLVWQNSQTGDARVWYMHGAAFTGQSDYLVQGQSPNWRLVGSADLNGDGTPDLIWQNSQSGDVYFWLMKGHQRIAGGYIAHKVALAWKIVGTADLNHDGNSGLIWQNTASGDVVFWPMKGIFWSGAYTYIARGNAYGWNVVGTADIDHEGNTDLIWQNALTGDVVYWHMNGTAFGGYSYLAHGSRTEWHVVAVMDMNNDTNSDLIWQNTLTGDVIVWYMNGISLINYDFVERGEPPAWRIATTH